MIVVLNFGSFNQNTYICFSK